MKFKSLSILILLFISINNLFAATNWNISTVSGKSDKYKFKEYTGPYENKEIAIANWIYLQIPNDAEYGISSFEKNEKNKIINQKLETKNPEKDFKELYESIETEFTHDRYSTMSKYGVLPDQKIEKNYIQQLKNTYKDSHPKTYNFNICDVITEIHLKNDNDNPYMTKIDFTKICSNDLPQKNDSVGITFSGLSSEQIENIEINLFTNAVTKNSKTGKYAFTEINLGKKTIHLQDDNNAAFTVYESFKLKKDCQKQIYILFKLSLKKTDKIPEEINIKLNKNFEYSEPNQENTTQNIISDNYDENNQEVKSIIDENQNNEQINLEQELELQRQQEEQKQKEELELQKELELQQKELEKALQAANKNTNVTRNQKEYLQDYDIEDDYEINTNQKNTESFVNIENPDETDATGKSLLMKAAKSGNDWQIKNLIKSGADINMKDKDGWTALMYAVRYQENITPVILLLDSGADLYVENNFKTSALTIATCYNNNPEIIKQLLKYYEASNKDVLKSLTMLFISSQPTEFIQLAKLDAFIQKGVPLNTFYEGKTPLMYACQYGNSTEVIQVLLNNNAAVTLRSSEGKTAYDYASKNTNLDHDDVYWSLNRKK